MGYRGEGYTGAGYNRQDDGYGQGDYDADGYHSAPHGNAYDGGPYGDAPYVNSGGYPTLGHPSGGYPTHPGYPNDPSEAPDPYADGNDWYGDQTGARQTGFADTSMQLALRDPVRGYPPQPAHSDSGAGYPGQRRYDESSYVAYPGYEGVEEDSPGYGGRQEYGHHDDYETRMDPIVVDFDAPPGGYAPPAGYEPGWGAQQGRGFGQALQGDEFDGGYRDGYPDADMLSGPGTGPQRGGPKGPKKNKKGAAPRPRRRSRAVILTAAGVVLVAAAGFGGYKYLVKQKDHNSAAEGTNKPLPTSAPSAATAQCVKQFGEFCHIQTRASDPALLTLSQVYPAAFFSESAKADFSRVATKEDRDCSKAVIGNDFITQLKKGQCNQVLRASYVSGDGTMMGTIGVINLSSTNQAHYAGKIIGAQNFIMPLASSKGPAAKLGQGTGVVEAQYKGHYVISIWAEFTNLKSPTTPQTQQLEAFENALVAGTANIILSQRMIDGDTPATAPSASASASAKTSASASSSPSK